MEALQEVSSPDGLLKLAVLEEGPSIVVGLLGFEWHTHGDLLVGEYQRQGVGVLSERGAAEKFVAEVVAGEWAVMVARVNGAVSSAWLSDDVESEFENAKAGVVLEARKWNGEPWHS